MGSHNHPLNAVVESLRFVSFECCLIHSWWCQLFKDKACVRAFVSMCVRVPARMREWGIHKHQWVILECVTLHAQNREVPNCTWALQGSKSHGQILYIYYIYHIAYIKIPPPLINVFGWGSNQVKCCKMLLFWRGAVDTSMYSIILLHIPSKKFRNFQLLPGSQGYRYIMQGVGLCD
jgi:hypothetical protein